MSFCLIIWFNFTPVWSCFAPICSFHSADLANWLISWLFGMFAVSLPCVLLANKADMVHLRQVTTEEGKLWWMKLIKCPGTRFKFIREDKEIELISSIESPQNGAMDSVLQSTKPFHFKVWQRWMRRRFTCYWLAPDLILQTNSLPSYVVAKCFN